MSRTAIITDTDSSLPLELAKKYNIVQVPIIIQFGDEGLRDIFDIDDKTLFRRIDKEKKLPTTAAPAPGQFIEAYKQAFESGADSILCYTISSEMSAVYQSAMSAKDIFPDRDITVIDSRTLCLGQGYMVLAAAEALAKGASKEEAIAVAEDVRQRTYLYAALATLKYLAMSGRVGHLAAGLAGMLEVKPILTIIDGKLQLLERIRTQRKSWARVVELAVEAAAGRKIERMALLHASASDAARDFEPMIRQALPCSNLMYASMNPGLSIHTGTGLVGVVFTTTI
jgi:DegV family protein with EDD domain